jgi:hypothetical protein
MSAPRLYFSGVDRAEHLRILSQEGGAGMISADVARSPSLLAAVRAYPDVPLVVDSKWRKSCSFGEYADLLAYLDSSLPGRFAWYASYDVACQEASDTYYNELIRRLPYLHAKILWIFRLTWGTREERLRQVERLYQARKTWQPVGLGGLVPILRRSTGEALQLLQEVGEVLGELSLPTHGLGVSSPDVLFWLRTQPWLESVDSSRWLVAWRGREVALLDGTQRRVADLSLPLTAEECARINIRAMQGWLNPLATPQLALWQGLPEKETQEAVRQEVEPSASERMDRWLLTHHSRIVRHHQCGTSPDTGSLCTYVPLFTVAGREYGLMEWEMGTTLPPPSAWSVIWDGFPDGPFSQENQRFLIDNQLKSGLYSHDDAYYPCLSRFSLPIAIAVAKAMSPV